MQDPCNPTPHPAAHSAHHQPSGQVIAHHAPGHVVGRISRHGTHRLARRLHAMAATCPAGPPLTIGVALLKTVAPAAAFVGLTAIASSLAGRDAASPWASPVVASLAAASYSGTPMATGSIGQGVPGAGGNPGTVAVAHKPSPHHPQVNVPEPPSLALLLVLTIGWLGLRYGLRRTRPAS